jgi:hypothetical protein
MSTQEGEEGIRTSDLRFMKRGSQPIELPLENYNRVINSGCITLFINSGRSMPRINKLCGENANKQFFFFFLN